MHTLRFGRKLSLPSTIAINFDWLFRGDQVATNRRTPSR
jgi:hypothetical protein